MAGKARVHTPPVARGHKTFVDRRDMHPFIAAEKTLKEIFLKVLTACSNAWLEAVARFGRVGTAAGGAAVCDSVFVADPAQNCVENLIAYRFNVDVKGCVFLFHAFFSFLCAASRRSRNLQPS